jgi:hypothetical protein
MDMNPEMMDEEQGEPVTCLMICLNPDGTATVSSKQMPAQDGQPAASLDEAFEIARGLAENPEDDAEAMQAAQSGYARKAQPQMNAPSPEGLFGE